MPPEVVPSQVRVVAPRAAGRARGRALSTLRKSAVGKVVGVRATTPWKQVTNDKRSSQELRLDVGDGAPIWIHWSSVRRGKGRVGACPRGWHLRPVTRAVARARARGAEIQTNSWCMRRCGRLGARVRPWARFPDVATVTRCTRCGPRGRICRVMAWPCGAKVQWSRNPCAAARAKRVRTDIARPGRKRL